MNRIRHYVRTENYLFLDDIKFFDLEERDCFGNNLLAYASTKKMANYLLKKGYSLTNKNKYDEGVILQSLKFKNPSLTWFLIKSGAPLPKKNQFVISKSLFSNSLVEYFLSQNISIDEINIKGETPLFKLVNICLDLISHGYRIPLENFKTLETLVKNNANFKRKNKFGISPEDLVLKELERLRKKENKLFFLFHKNKRKSILEVEKIKNILNMNS